MVCSKSSCCRSWGKVDKILLVLLITGFALSALGAMRAMRHALRDRHRYHFEAGSGERGGRRHPRPDDDGRQFEEVDCELAEVGHERLEVECRRNERGEWCAGRLGMGIGMGMGMGMGPGWRDRGGEDRPGNGEEDSREHMLPEDQEMPGGSGGPRVPGGPRGRLGMGMGMGPEDRREHMLSEDQDMPGGPRGSSRPGGPGDEKPRMTLCIQIHVTLLRQGPDSREKRILAHVNFLHATNFPMCSFSTCEASEARDRHMLDNFKRHWEAQLNKPARCLVSRNDSRQVVIMMNRMYMRGFLRSASVYLSCLAFLLSVVCTLVLLVRRCRTAPMQTKTVQPENRVTLPAVVHVSAPQQPVSDKEKEAFGLSPLGVALPITNLPQPDFLMLVPPTYTESVSSKPDVSLPPPAYVSTVSLHGENHESGLTPTN